MILKITSLPLWPPNDLWPNDCCVGYVGLDWWLLWQDEIRTKYDRATLSEQKWNRMIFFFKCYFTNVNLFIFSFFEPNFISKVLWESVFFLQNLATIEMRWDKNRLFCRHFETVQHFRIFFAELWFFIASTYMVQISLQNSVWKVVFSGGSMDPPCTNGSKSTLVT